MRTLAIVLALATTGCAVATKQVMAPQVAARVASEKSARVVAECSAKAMGRELHDDDSGLYILHQNGVVLRARWDFVPTTTGSDAELRGPADYDAGIDLVRECAKS